MERHVEEAGEAVIKGSRVRDQEDENDDRGDHFQGAALVAFSEEVRHGAAVERLGHDACAASQDGPGEERSDKGVAEADPGGGHTEAPSELTCVTDEDNGGEIRGSEGEGCEPWSHGASAENEAVDIRRVPAAVEADAQHNSKEDDEKNDLKCHNVTPL